MENEEEKIRIVKEYIAQLLAKRKAREEERLRKEERFRNAMGIRLKVSRTEHKK